MRNEITMFIPACGKGERMLEIMDAMPDRVPRNKAFVAIEGRPAIDHVLAMRPGKARVDIALPASHGCIPLQCDATVHLIREETTSQADTIRRWLRDYAADRLGYVLISNCDNVIDKQTINDGISAVFNRRCSGVVFTFKPTVRGDERFSYVEAGPDGIVHNVEEGVAVSNMACAGVYFLFLGHLRAELQDGDTHLSQALARLHGLRAMRARHYYAWNDPAQYAELHAGVKQYA